MNDYFYSSEEEQTDVQKNLSEAITIFRFMRSAHFGFFRGMAIDASLRTQKLPYSRRWKVFKKLNPEYRSPSDYDKKHHRIVDYSAGYSVG